jgi:lipoate-protein ligase A
MLCVCHGETDPAWNLAAEEYLLKTSREDCFMLWRNQSAVIVGRNQNTLAQINMDFLKTHNIPVVRRLSGGGAVYHDLGNVNFTIIKQADSAQGLDFRPYTRPILDFLEAMQVPAAFDGRNDLTIDGRKISGNAQYLWEGKVLHHGTLLFDVNLQMLAAVLQVDSSKYRDKAIQSISQRVTNISHHLSEDLSVTEFIERIFTHIQRAHNGRRATFSKTDMAAIEGFARGRYRRWEWNFGDSPAYNFHKSSRTSGGTIEVRLDVHGGIIRAARLYGDYFGIRDIGEVEAALVGRRHEHADIAETLESLAVEEYIHGVTASELVRVFF